MRLTARRGLRLITAILVMAVPACSQAPPNRPTAEVEGIRTLTRLKSDAEQWTSRIKGDYGRNTAEFRKAQTLYIPAKTAVDVWINELKHHLIVGTDITASESYKRSLEEANAATRLYIAYVDELYVGKAAPGFDLILGGIGVLANAGVDIYLKVQDAKRKGDEARRKGITDLIDSLKWKAFGEVT